MLAMSVATEDTKSGFSSGTSTNAITLPRVFGRLLLLRLLARGGMGDVYLAATTGIEGAERACVVKTVRRDHIHDGSFLARFLDEARVQAQLTHPGVAQVLEASNDENGEPYTVVEYVEGRSLADVRQRAVQVGVRIEWPEAVAIALEMAQALAHVHERSGADGTPLGIVHRDLSPQNVMVGFAGELKLIDFGTARGQNRKCHTVAGVVFAKPGYVAPEVARQQVGDGRIDVYALGVMLWELCAGKRLLSGDAQKHLEDAAAGRLSIPKLEAWRGIPPELDAVIQKLTENNPDERYMNGAQAAKDLANVLQLSPSPTSGERGVRGRIAALMKSLWPSEPARSRAEFAKLLKEARSLRGESSTPSASKVAELAAQLTDDPSMLAGTPYRFIKKIGEGESGQVFEAEHVELGRKIALKVLAPTHSSAQNAIERFRREARVVASLSHPNIVHLSDFGKSLDGRVFLAMELLEGETLDHHAHLSDERGHGDEPDDRTQGLSPAEATRIAIQVTRALEAAHDAGLVHRDLKPQNLFVTRDGVIKLLDFGVAMAVSDVAGEGTVRQKGFAIFGTPEYMAPEQVAGELVDARCDIYALGCVLYQLLTGTCPFIGTSGVAIMGKQVRDLPEPFASVAPRRVIPPALEAVVMRALSKSPDDRYPSARAMREAIEAIEKSTSRRRGVGRAVVGMVGLAAFGVLVAGGLNWARWQQGRVASAHIPTLTAAVVPNAQVPHAPVSPREPAPPAIAASELPQAAAAPPAASPERHEPKPGAPERVPASNKEILASTPAVAPRSGGGEEAKSAAKEAEEMTPTPSAREPGSPLQRASLHESSPNDTRAELELARKDAEAHPSDPRALRAWARAAYRNKDYKEARRAARDWASRDGSAEPRIFLATVLEASGNRGEARAVLEEWLAKHPDSSDARRMRSRLGGERRPHRH